MADSFLIRKIKTARVYAHWTKKIWHPGRKCAYLIGTPTHTNIGDSAIVVAEIAFLKKCGYEDIVEITVKEYEAARKCIVRLIPPKADIFFPGGGNMGDLWPMEEIWRSQMIEDFPSHNIVIFPQTIYYSETPDGERRKEQSVSVYNTKKNLTIVAREKVSFDYMRRIYPNASVILSPDIVLSMQLSQYTTARSGILTCFRNDKEKALADEDKARLIDILQSRGYQVGQIDTMSDVPITVDNRKEIVERKLSQMAKARLVITDRLHGMVFSAITGTPCIVLGNNHHKVYGTYEWLEHLDYIVFVRNVDEAADQVEALYPKGQCQYQMDQAQFSELQKLISELASK